jgi:hypothetical protein
MERIILSKESKIRSAENKFISNLGSLVAQGGSMIK